MPLSAPVKTGSNVTAMMPSGRVVRAKVINQKQGGQFSLSYAGLPPFDARALSHSDLLEIEAASGRGQTS